MFRVLAYMVNHSLHISQRCALVLGLSTQEYLVTVHLYSVFYGNFLVCHIEDFFNANYSELHVNLNLSETCVTLSSHGLLGYIYVLNVK